MLFLILFEQTVYNLPFFQSAVSNCCKYCIPITESVLFLNDLLIFRFKHIRQVNPLALTVSADQIFSADNIIFFKFFFKPGIDLTLCLCTLDDIQPVTARSLGVLRCKDLNPVSVLDLIIDVYKLTVHSGADHLIADCTVDRIGKVNRCGAIRKVLHIPVRCKAVYIFLEQIQVTFQQA